MDTMKRLNTRVQSIKRWVGENWRRTLIYGGGAVLGLLLVVQIFYPSDRVVPFTKIETVSVGGWLKKDASWELDRQYEVKKVQLFFGDSKTPYREIVSADIGLKTDNLPRVESAGYSWWMRLIPTSLFWAHMTLPSTPPSYHSDSKRVAQYISKELGESCDVAPKNASFVAKEGKLTLVESEKGGTCKREDVDKQLLAVKPTLSQSTTARVPMKTIAPEITDDAANAVIKKVTERLGEGVGLRAGDVTVSLPAAEVASWVDPVADGKVLQAVVNPERASTKLNKDAAPKVARAAGVSKVSTMDFVETSRQDGAKGQAMDLDATVRNITDFLQTKAESANVAVRVVQPKIEYSRSYSPTDTGLSALLQQYAESHPGTYGVSLVELSGQRRRAAYQDTKQFRTASTYKLFVAYSTLKRVESGVWKWSDAVSGGRNLEKCFDDMIVKSDNPCAEALLTKIGFRAITDEMKSIGLTGTSFLGDIPLTTAGDLSTFNASLESGQLLSADSRTRLLGAMKRNIYRQGIPAGTSSQVADKVGFLDGLLHDAAIIYTPSGPVVLSIMTDGSSWATIADLTKQIEALRAR